MDENGDYVCEMRYCPDCGTEIFCKTDSNNETLYFLSESMNLPLLTCPECQLDLVNVPIQILDSESKNPEIQRKLRSKSQAGIKQLSDALYNKNRLIFPDKRTAKTAMKDIGEVFLEFLSDGSNVKLAGVGSLKIVERKARKGRSPVTGEELDIPAKKVVKFVPSKALKEKMNP